ncbi:hypothetical protein R1flu_015360 [Riccia fluitans]|uniref:F-box domain-containing protein n=1 Tax=Riccia fluitans TaxID=41844 RepID=A0ABD1YJS1_9MARC
MAARPRDRSEEESGGQEFTVEETDCTLAIDLPNDLVVKIIQKVPFPHCFKARLLNREWRHRFSQRMSLVSHNWPSHCPALLSPGGELNLLDRSSGRWHKLSFQSVQTLDRRNTYGVFGPVPAGILDGALFCTLSTSRDGVYATVLNLLSSERRVIPCPVQGRCLPIFNSVGVDRYHLVLLGEEADGKTDFEPNLSTWCYDSLSHSWVQKSLPHGRLVHMLRYLPHLGRLCYVFLDGHLYWYFRKTKSWTFQVYRASLEDGTESECPPVVLGSEDLLVFLTFELLKCESRVIMVVIWGYNEGNECRVSASIYEVERENFTLRQLSTSPPSLLPACDEGTMLEIKSVADNEYIYLCWEQVVSYHIESGIWNTHGPPPAAAHSQCTHNLLHKKLCKLLCGRFQPGLNPFVVP